MPTGREITKAFIHFIHSHFNLQINDFDESVKEDFFNTDQAITVLQNHILLPNRIKDLLDCFLESKLGNQFMMDNFIFQPKFEIINFDSDEFKKRNRPFSISNNQFGYLSTKRLFDYSPISDIENDLEGFKTLIDFIGNALQLEHIQILIELINIIQNIDRRKGLLVHKFVHTNSSIMVYSYLYFQKLLQGGSIKLDSGINYTGSHGATTTFNNSLIYNQYFEVYDIINELNHATEIITRFLKLYHILEYLVYRVELVKVEEKARNNRTFIREINAIAGKGSVEKEWETLRKNFLVLFATETRAGHFNLGTLTPEQQTFFSNNFGLASFNYQDPLQISQLVYRLRNSIVHNKESEFHMTMTNPDDYREIIPLIIIFIEKLERIIFNKIALDFASISYKGHQSIKLY